MLVSDKRSEPPGTGARPWPLIARRVYLTLVMVSGTAVLCLSAVDVIARPPGVLWFVLAALTLVSGTATFRMPGFPVSFALADTFTISAALLFGPAAGAIL